MVGPTVSWKICGIVEPESGTLKVMRSSIALANGCTTQIGYGSNRKTRHLMPSGHKAFVVHNPNDVDLLLMHSKTFAAEYVQFVMQ